MAQTEFDICVIGGGAAGLVVAAGAATLGAKVALAEKQALGGDCLYHGCVPSKSLLHAAQVAHTVRGAGRFGLHATLAPVDLGAVMRHVGEVIDSIAVHDSPERFRGLGVEVLFGAGRFSSPEVFEIEGRSLTARRFVVATGSRPALPPFDGLKSVPHLTNQTVFSLTQAVSHLVVLGGGPVGVELAQAFSRLGSRVTLVELAPQLLPQEDQDVAAVLGEALSTEGIEVLTGCRARSVASAGSEIALTVAAPDGQDRVVTGSHLLVATGRRANVDNLGLEAAKVQVRDGRIVTDKRMRTSNRRIFACGDVVGPYQLTHMAEHQAQVVLKNAVLHLPARVERRVIPWCTFTDPEVARVGLSEGEAVQRGVPHRVYRFPLRDVDRARTQRESCGMAKLVTRPNGRILGAAVVGPAAGELIHEYVLALRAGMKTSDISSAIHVYPTLAQLNRKVADSVLKGLLTPRRKRWLKRLLSLRGD